MQNHVMTPAERTLRMIEDTMLSAAERIHGLIAQLATCTVENALDPANKLASACNRYAWMQKQRNAAMKVVEEENTSPEQKLNYSIDAREVEQDQLDAIHELRELES